MNTLGDFTGTRSLELNGADNNGLYARSFAARSGANGVSDEIWITDAPTPGAAALLGLAGIAGIRRRR